MEGSFTLLLLEEGVGLVEGSGEGEGVGVGEGSGDGEGVGLGEGVGSSAPVRLTVYVADVVSVLSEAMNVKESATESPLSRASTAAESGV